MRAEACGVDGLRIPPCRERLGSLALIAATQMAIGSTAMAQNGARNAEFNLDSAAYATAEANGALAGGDSAFTGNPAATAAGWWPDALVAAPIPGYSPQLGFRLTVVAGYYLDLDRRHATTPSSVVGAIRIRVGGGAAALKLNYRYYGNGAHSNSVGITQDAELRYATGKYQVLPGLYAGLGFFDGKAETRLANTALLPPELADPQSKLDLAALELPLEFDSRDDTMFPRTGWLVYARGMLYRSSFGSDVTADAFSVEANNYRPVRGQDVLALRAYYRTVQVDVPFYLLSSFGGKRDLRGYESGRYRDQMMYAVQAE
jgi:hypothetical protein